MTKKALFILMALTLATGLFAIDVSTKVSLNFLSMADMPKDNDFVLGKINEKLLQDLNCELKFTYLTWTDWQNRYALMLASGEPMDAAYGASWLNYYVQAKKGAFLALDDLLPKYAPVLNRLVPKAKWDGVKVGGKIYGVPRWDYNFVQRGFMYREDLRAKYKVPEIKSVDSMIAYLDAIKKNEPKMVGMTESNWMAELIIYVTKTKYQWIDGYDPYGATTGMLVADPSKPSELLSIFDLPEYKTLVTKMKECADKGYWAKDILSYQGNPKTDFAAGLAASQPSANPDGPPTPAATWATEHPDWKVGYYFYPDLNNTPQSSMPAQDVTVILPRSKNPERALMVVEKFLSDRSYFNLFMYGVEGRNYKVAADGSLDNSWVPAEQKFGGVAMWCWLNRYFELPKKYGWEGRNALLARLEKTLVPNPFSGFAIDTTAVQAEAAAITQVYNQYVKPLQTGLVANVDTALAQVKDRMKSAGFEKWKVEIQKQLQAWLKAK